MTPETKITEHLTYRELTNSATGRRLGLENKPNEQELENIKKTAERLEKIRAWLGKKYGREVSIHVLSCFRSEAVNRAVGGFEFEVGFGHISILGLRGCCGGFYGWPHVPGRCSVHGWRSVPKQRQSPRRRDVFCRPPLWCGCRECAARL